jgi:hypothetical protein
LEHAQQALRVGQIVHNAIHNAILPGPTADMKNHVATFLKRDVQMGIRPYGGFPMSVCSAILRPS